MTKIISVQHSKGGSGTTALALSLAHASSGQGRTLYIELDVINPILEALLPPPKLPIRYSNDWITGETPLDEAAVDVSSVFNRIRHTLYFMYANRSVGAINRMQVIDAVKDKRIIKTLEKEKWVIGLDLDFVVIDTPPWMSYIIAAASLISDYVFYILRPNKYELDIMKDWVDNILSHFKGELKAVVNFVDETDEKVKKFEEELKKVVGEHYVKIPYIAALSSGLDVSRLLSNANPMLPYLQNHLRLIFPKPIEVT